MNALAVTACLSTEDCEYLVAKGYDSVAVLARAGKSDNEFITRVVDPYVAGVTIDTVVYKATSDIIEASSFGWSGSSPSQVRVRQLYTVPCTQLASSFVVLAAARELRTVSRVSLF
jgi:hypothetical protein